MDVLIIRNISLIILDNQNRQNVRQYRDGSRAAVTSKMEHFVIIVHGSEPASIITQRSILDVAAALDPPL